MGDIAMTEVQRDRVDAYLAGKGPVTRFWQRKHEVLVGFYRFVIAPGYALDVPLPRRVPTPAQAFVPHIYSHDELRRLRCTSRSTLRTFMPEMKAKALAKCQVTEPAKANRRWCEDLKLMAFLHSL